MPACSVKQFRGMPDHQEQGRRDLLAIAAIPDREVGEGQQDSLIRRGTSLLVLWWCGPKLEVVSQ